jgi:hypothetical protein
LSEHECKPKLDYPCLWVYKVIGRDPERIRSAIAEIMGETAHSLTFSRSSISGAYHCLNLETRVESETVRIGLYGLLRRHPAVVMIL